MFPWRMKCFFFIFIYFLFRLGTTVGFISWVMLYPYKKRGVDINQLISQIVVPGYDCWARQLEGVVSFQEAKGRHNLADEPNFCAQGRDGDGWAQSLSWLFQFWLKILGILSFILHIFRGILRFLFNGSKGSLTEGSCIQQEYLFDDLYGTQKSPLNFFSISMKF